MSYRNFVYTVGPRAASLVVAILLATPLVAVAESGEFEEVFVNGQAVQADSFIVEITKQDIVDTSQYLKMMPGANSNSNGVLSGIAQYRGLFGERVAVSIDDVEPVSGGPNAMDAPLSYSSPMITEALTLHRGISSIRLAPETIGGHVNAELARGKFGLSDTFLSSGFLGSNYRTNGSQSTNALRLTGANSSHRLSVLAEIDRGEDIETPRGDIFPSDMHRNRFDLSYAYQSDTSHMMAYVGKLDTKDTGSPALVMDIRTIETDLAGFEYDRTINEALSYGLKFSYNDVHHTMDNFSLRTPPGDPMMYRLNNASGEASGLQAYGKYSLEFVAINLGINVKQAAHNSTITNPNMAMFQVANFNDVEKDLQSIYAEFAGDNNEGMQWEFGVRHNRHSTNAGEVSSAGMMAMMVENTDSLATAFNNANRDLSFSNTDAVAKYTRSLTANSKFLLEIGSKSRAPSYQELYLWLPLETTGGLADGRTYIGNLELNSERSNEVNLGYEFTGAR
ncbi:MAG: iron complex outermembrane receptor protein, partial [Lentisphaeria bacterium]